MTQFNRGTVTDIAKLLWTVGLGGLTAVTPRAARRSLLTGLAAVGSRINRDDLDRLAELAGERHPEISEPGRHTIAVEMRTLRIEHAMCRGYGVFRKGWPARIEVTGADRLRAAHAEGRGVVMWVMSFLDMTPFNLTAAAEGHPVTHLSTPGHGLRDHGPISRRLVAPIVLHGERRSHGRRLVIPPEGGMGYLRELLKVLETKHGTVTIRGDYTLGRRMIEAPFLNEIAAFPTGAPGLAHRTGAPLLTTATIRRGPFDHEVIIDEPISISRELDRHTYEYEAVQEFAARLDRRARLYPGSRPWTRLQQSRPAAT